LLTTNPTRDGPGLAPGSRWTTRVWEPERRPLRAARRNESASVRRWAEGSKGCRRPTGDRAVRRPGSYGPCGDARREWICPLACACAGGNRGPCGDVCCSAGTYACSRAISFSGGSGAVTPGVSAVSEYNLTFRLAPPTHGECVLLPWTCGTGRHRGDRQTVRVGVPQGQTGMPIRLTTTSDRPGTPENEAERNPTASLWMKACRGYLLRVTFGLPEIHFDGRKIRTQHPCDHRHNSGNMASDLGKQRTRTLRRVSERRALAVGEPGSQPVEKAVDTGRQGRRLPSNGGRNQSARALDEQKAETRGARHLGSQCGMAPSRGRPPASSTGLAASQRTRDAPRKHRNHRRSQ